MELESCQKLTHTQNVFYSRPTIHKQTQCDLQMQNIFHKLMHFVLQMRNVPIKSNVHHTSETNTACFTHTKKHISSSTKKYPSSTKNNSSFRYEKNLKKKQTKT